MKSRLLIFSLIALLHFSGSIFAIDTTISTNTTSTYNLSDSENLIVNANIDASSYGINAQLVNAGIVTINPAKSVSAVYAGVRLTYGNIGSLTNNGAIGNGNYLSGYGSGIWLYGASSTLSSTMQTLINTGTIQVNGGQGSSVSAAAILLDNYTTLNNIENRSGGSIDGTGGRAAILLSGANSAIGTITNMGLIQNGINHAIYNQNGTIGVINNLQGSGTPLTYEGLLPTNYNIIINGSSQFGRLAGYSVTGRTTFGIYSGSTLAVGTYPSVVTGLTSSNLLSTSGTLNGFNWNLVNSGSASIWDLVLTLAGPSAADTQSSLEISANALKGIYALQTSSLTAGLTYDCSIFDKNGICVSAGGRYNRVNTGETKAANGLLMGAYKVNPNIRVGAWVDQNLSVNTGTGVNLSNSKPMFGLFGVWNAHPSGHGFEARVSAGYGDKDLTVTREAVGSSGEAGTGTARLNAQGVSVVFSYNAPVMVHWVASPYLGARYTKVRAGGYTESDAVTTPLTFGELKQEAATALVGMNVSGRVMSNLGVFAGLGAELDTTTRGNNYSATGVTGLTDIAFNPNIKRLRGSANAGFYLEVDKTQRISLNAIYREEAFASMNTISSMLTYTAGF